MADPIDETCIYDAIGGKCTSRAGPAEVDKALGRLAGRQHGVVARWQALAIGVTARAIDVRLAKGRLHRVHQGVYAVGHQLLTAHGHCMAAVLSCGTGALLSHRSAAWLWGLIPESPVEPEVVRPNPFRRRAGIKARHVAIAADEMEVVGLIPATCVARTLFDLSSIVPRQQLEKAFNESEVRQLTSRLSLHDLLERYPRHRGSAALKTLLGDERGALGATRLELEERFTSLLRGSGLPRPRFNAALAIRGRFFEADCLWAERRLIVELDGRAVHGTRRAFERDRARDRLLQVEGWRVVRITWLQLRDEPEAVIADLRRLLVPTL